MTYSDIPFFLSTTARPLWAPADEGAALGGADDATTTTDDGKAPGGADDGAAQAPVLGGDQPGDDLDDGAAVGDDDGGGGVNKGGDDDDPRTDDEKAADEKSAAVPGDGAYEFELPEGTELADDKREFWQQGFHKAGLTNGQAQALIALQSQQVADDQADFAKAMEAQQVEHLTAAKADKEIGGDNWAASTKLANQGLAALRGGPKGDPETKNTDGTLKGLKPAGALENLILSSGQGNNPEMIRELGRIGKLFANDRFDAGGEANTPTPRQKKWYADTTPDTKKG